MEALVELAIAAPLLSGKREWCGRRGRCAAAVVVIVSRDGGVRGGGVVKLNLRGIALVCAAAAATAVTRQR